MYKKGTVNTVPFLPSISVTVKATLTGDSSIHTVLLPFSEIPEHRQRLLRQSPRFRTDKT